MCGIAGVIVAGPDARPGELGPLVQLMVTKMLHRGPDSSGSIDCGGAHLGSCRLAVLGLEPASAQPLRSPESPTTVVFNGEIYNYVELREVLRSAGHIFASTGDTEIIVHAYEEWGDQCVQRFEGMFAFALHDGLKHRVLLARDRFGVKPLYYSTEAGLLLFASEPQALLSTGLVSAEVNLDVLSDFLEYGVTDAGDQCFYARIKQLLPGHIMVIEKGGISVSEWFSTSTDAMSSQRYHSLEDWVVAFKASFEKSCMLRVRSDVPVAVLLSGGLDSSSITAVCANQPTRWPIRAFVASFPNTPIDETAWAEMAAEWSHMSITKMQVPEINEESVRCCLKAQGEPFISPSMVAQWLVMEVVHRSGIRVALTGQGADEYLGGYEYFDAFAVVEMAANHDLAGIASHLRLVGDMRRRRRVIAEVAFLILPSEVKRFYWSKPWLRDRVRRVAESRYFRELTAARTLRDAVRFHMKWRLAELLRYEDRNSMAFSIETRHPFLDQMVVELCQSCPSELIVGHGFRKRVLRLGMQGIVSPRILARRDKIGFQTPDYWFRSPAFGESLRRLIAEAPDELRQLIDFEKLVASTRKPASRRNQNDLWRVYCTLLWYQECVIPNKRKSQTPAPNGVSADDTIGGTPGAAMTAAVTHG